MTDYVIYTYDGDGKKVTEWHSPDFMSYDEEMVVQAVHSSFDVPEVEHSVAYEGRDSSGRLVTELRRDQLPT